MSKLNPFDYVTAIYEKKVINEMAGFNPYLCNHSLSNNLDTCLIANEMNAKPDLPPEAQYGFLFHAVRKGRRFGQWNKPSDNPHVDTVMEFYNCSKNKSLEALTVLSQRELRLMREQLDNK